MSLRIIIKPERIASWIAERHGLPARRHGSDTDLQIVFHEPTGPCEPLTLEELVEAMKSQHRALLVDETPGRTFHRFIERG